MAQQKQHWARALSDAMNLATTVAACVALGWFGGKWLDSKLNMEILRYVGVLLGVAAGMKAMWQMAERNSKKSAASKDAQKEESE
jgi:F0F1-type ATP synthase assembly protein I